MITTPVLRQLAAAGATTQLSAKGVPGGFVLAIRVGLEEQLLEAQRGGVRKFRRLDALSRYVRALGLSSFDVQMTGWRDGQGLL